MTTFLGIIIFAIPFIFIRFFKDKTVGFLFIFTSSFLMHFIVALATQSVKIFNHSTIIEIYTIIDIFLLFVYWGAWRRGYFPKKHVFGDNIIATESLVKITSESNTKIPAEGNAKHLAKKGWIQKTLVFMAFAIVFLNLISVHYNFSGIINTYVGEYHVDKSAYEYPYFSDEWVAISFVNYAIDSQSLPTVNPLNGDGEFRNPLIPYFSFLADTFLFFGFSPVNDFTLLTFLIGFTICILFFILLNSLGIDKRVSAITLLIVPYITNGGNLPGIWFLIPMVVGLVFYLISLISLAKKDNGLLFVSSIMCLSLYPPFIAFVFPTLLTLFFRKKEWNWKKIFIVLSSIFFAFLLVASITLNNLNPNYVLDALRFYCFRWNLVGGILSFPIWVVLPVFTLPVALFGFRPAFKNKLYFIILPTLVGLTFWYCYIDTERVFVIDFPRAVVITSFLILVLFALSLNYLLNKITRGDDVEIISVMFTSVTMVCIMMAASYSLNYTENESWRSLMMKLNMSNKKDLSSPAPTASRFLTDDDIRLFSGFTKKNFISPPWKGLVISAATGNYPMTTKPSTIGVFTMNYDWFVDTNCRDRRQASIDNNISYAYATKIDCPNFIKEGESSEGLILYRFKK